MSSEARDVTAKRKRMKEKKRGRRIHLERLGGGGHERVRERCEEVGGRIGKGEGGRGGGW